MTTKFPASKFHLFQFLYFKPPNIKSRFPVRTPQPYLMPSSAPGPGGRVTWHQSASDPTRCPWPQSDPSWRNTLHAGSQWAPVCVWISPPCPTAASCSSGARASTSHNSEERKVKLHINCKQSMILLNFTINTSKNHWEMVYQMKGTIL